MKSFIKEKRYNKYKNDEYCKFTFDKNIDCIEYGI